MRIIIKDSKLNLKVKTDNIKLAELILLFFTQENRNTDTAFKVGIMASNLMNQIKNSIKSEVHIKNNGEVVPPAPNADIEKIKDKLAKQDYVKTKPMLAKPKCKYRHKVKFVRWTDDEIIFMKNNLTLNTKHLVKMPELARHTILAILTKRNDIKYRKGTQLSKHHLALIK